MTAGKELDLESASTISLDQLQDIALKWYVASRKMGFTAPTPLLVGPPGSGKSDAVRCVFRTIEKYRQEIEQSPGKTHFILVHADTKHPTDIAGILHITRDENGREVCRVVPSDLISVLQALGPNDHAIVCFDDMHGAVQLVQMPCMQLIREGELGGLKIPRHQIMFFVTGNRRQDRAGSQGFITPFVNRCALFDLVIPLDDWKKYMLEKGYPDWIVGFANFKPSGIQTRTLENVSAITGGESNFPSYRSWEELAKSALAGAGGVAIYSAFIGAAVGQEAAQFERTWHELPSLEQILNEPATARIPDGASAKYALMGMLSSRTPKSKVGQMVQYLNRLPGQELTTVCIRDILQRLPELASTAPIVKWAVEHNYLLGEE